MTKTAGPAQAAGGKALKSVCVRSSKQALCFHRLTDAYVYLAESFAAAQTCLQARSSSTCCDLLLSPALWRTLPALPAKRGLRTQISTASRQCAGAHVHQL